MNKNKLLCFILTNIIILSVITTFPAVLADNILIEVTESNTSRVMPDEAMIFAQEFTLSHDATLEKVSLKVFGQGYGNFVYGISTQKSAKTKNWEFVDGTLAENCNGWTIFDFEDIDLTEGVYHLMVGNINLPEGEDVMINWDANNDDPYPGGEANYYKLGGNWGSYEGLDFNFKIYGTYLNSVDYNALLIGVGDYPGEVNDLPLPPKDVSAMKSALLSGSNWDEDNIKTLVNSKATLANVKDSLENWLADREDEDDISLIYYTGHGTTLTDDNGDEEDGIDECLVLFDQFFVDDDFKDILDNSFEGRIVIIIDSCFSGGMPCASGQEENKCDYWNKEFTNSLSGQNRALLMSSQEDESSLGIRFGDGNNGFSHGFLTIGVLSGLHGSADEDDNSDITVKECFEYSINMIKETQEIIYHNIMQNPTTHYDSNDLKNIKIVKDNTNSPPNKPQKPSGPGSDLKQNKVYEFKSCIIDPEEGELEVLFYWDDETISIKEEISSGEECSFHHIWKEVDDYNIRLIAIDEEGAISEWSDPLAVSMPKIKHKGNVIENQFMENIFLKYPVLREMLSLIKNIFSNLFQK